MQDPSPRVRLEGIDLKQVLPVLNIGSAFGMALQPTKLLLGLMTVLLIYFGGVTLDFIWGVQTEGGVKYHVFDKFVTEQLLYFQMLIDAALSLNFGMVEGPGRLGVIGALAALVYLNPAELFSEHPWFFLLLFVFGLIVKMAMGGAIARLAAMQACRDQSGDLMEAGRFAGRQLFWLVVAPLLPTMIALFLLLLLAIAGWILFTFPVVNLIGALLYGVALIIGLLAACMLLLTLFGATLFPAAIAVEGTDAFDAVSRVFSFLIYRAIRYLFYLAVVLVYGALTYVIVGLVLFVTLWLTRAAVGLWAEELFALQPTPSVGELVPAPAETASLEGADRAASWIVRAWTGLFAAMGLAYVVSYLFTAQVWVYLLLRRSLDATDFSEFDETGIGDTLASREMAAAKVPDEPVDAEPTVPEQEPGDAPA